MALGGTFDLRSHKSRRLQAAETPLFNKLFIDVNYALSASDYQCSLSYKFSKMYINDIQQTEIDNPPDYDLGSKRIMKLQWYLEVD